MLVHPKDLSPQTLYAIDQFVMRGGKLIAFVDPQSENDPAAAQHGRTDGDGAALLHARPAARCVGRAASIPARCVGDRELGLTVALRQGQPPSQHIAIIGFNRDSMNTRTS